LLENVINVILQSPTFFSSSPRRSIFVFPKFGEFPCQRIKIGILHLVAVKTVLETRTVCTQLTIVHSAEKGAQKSVYGSCVAPIGMSTLAKTCHDSGITSALCVNNRIPIFTSHTILVKYVLTLDTDKTSLFDNVILYLIYAL
jgi:hypothetical protein